MIEDWPKVTLGSVLRRVRRTEAVADGLEYPSVSVTKDGQGLGAKDPFVGGVTNYKTLFQVRAGDVVVRTITAFESPVGVAEAAHDGAYVSQVFLTYETSPEVSPQYLRLVFQTPPFWAEMQNRATGSVLRRKTISDTAFRDISIPLPTLPDQLLIIDMIAAVDAQIAALAEEFAAQVSLYHVALGALTERFDAQPIGDVILKATSGGTPSRNRPDYFGGLIPWLKSGEVENDNIQSAEETITETGLSESSAKLVPAGSTLVAMYGQGDTKGRAGFVSKPVATNQAVLSLVPRREVIHPRYLLHAVRSRTESLRQRAVGAAQPNLSKGLVISEEIPVPSDLEEQREIAEALDALRAVGQALRVETQSLRVVRSNLLAVLLSGDVRIPEGYGRLVQGAV